MKEVQIGNTIPSNLTYVDDFYDKTTGTSGTAFRDKDTGEVIVAYTGTNKKGDFARDVVTDIVDIGDGLGTQYGPAYCFYEQMSHHFGADNITLTGHSLGGNIAQRVAIHYNAPKTVVYNSAPLYITSTKNSAIELIGDFSVVEGPASYAAISIAEFVPKKIEKEIADKNVSSINKDITRFDGQVIRFTTSYDFLNPISDVSGGVYVGEEYAIVGSKGHGAQPIVDDANQVAQIKAIIDSNLAATTAIETTQVAMSEVQSQKEDLCLNDNGGESAVNGLTNSEKIYLDAIQARTIVSGISTVVDAISTLTTSQVTLTNQNAEDLYNTLDDVPFYMILTSDEVKAAYDEANVNYDRIVTKVSKLCENKQSNVEDLVTDFKTLQETIEQGIDTLEQEDAQVAALFGLSS